MICGRYYYLQINENCEINEFLLELSGFLKELGCPYPQFVSGPMSNRLQTQDDRLLLLQFLISELMAWRMCHSLEAPERVVVEIVGYQQLWCVHKY